MFTIFLILLGRSPELKIELLYTVSRHIILVWPRLSQKSFGTYSKIRWKKIIMYKTPEWDYICELVLIYIDLKLIPYSGILYFFDITFGCIFVYQFFKSRTVCQEP